jgi:HlyD family secretion protein
VRYDAASEAMDGEDHMFRDRAVDSVAAADRINQVAPIVSARLWLLVLGGSVLCAALLGWSVLGRVPLTVRGTGILIEGTMVVAAESPADGRIAEVRVKPGDIVAQGDVIAVIANPALEAQRADAEAAVGRLKEQHLAMLRAEEGAMQAAEASLAVREDEARRRVELAQAAFAEYGRSVEGKRGLVAQGLLPESDLLSTVNVQLEIGRSLSEARSDVQRIAAERAELAMRHAQERQRRENAIADAGARVRHATALLDAERHVPAPRPGRVVQAMRAPGDLVRRGTPVAVVSDAGDGLMRCYAFFPLADGKRARAGMRARVEPSVADRERFGVIRGSVREVEPVVGTRDSLARIINSPEVAADIERRYGGIVSGVIDLDLDPSTPTGLRWTGGTGYPQPLSAGTLCDVDVVTEEVAPITLFIPWLRNAFGG